MYMEAIKEVKMKVLLNENNYVTDYAFIGNLNGGIEVIPSSDIDIKHFRENFFAYKFINNSLIFDEVQVINMINENEKTILREKRERECFPVINRGQLWYETLSDTELSELREWYQAWLDVTDTQEIPSKPSWITPI